MTEKNDEVLMRFANIQRSNLQSTLTDAIFDAHAYDEYKEYSNWVDEEGLFVKEDPQLGISLVVIESSIWYKTIKKVLREIEDNPNL